MVLRVLLLSLFMVLSQSSAYASSQQAIYLRLDPLLERVEVSLQVHQALVEQLRLDRETLLALGSAAGDDLQTIFVAMSKDYRDAVESAVSVSSVIAGVNQAAIILFEAWRDEIGDLTEPRLKADNEAQFTASWQRYEELIQSLQQSEGMIDPVLAELKSNLVYFRRALDESSVASRKTELSDTGNHIQALINALSSSVVRSRAFQKSMQ